MPVPFRATGRLEQQCDRPLVARTHPNPDAAARRFDYGPVHPAIKVRVHVIGDDPAGVRVGNEYFPHFSGTLRLVRFCSNRHKDAQLEDGRCTNH